MFTVKGSPSAINQYLAALTANLLVLSNGVFLGWTIFLPLLMSDKSPLPTGPITLDEGSWLVSIPCFGAFVGNICFTYLTRMFGRKKPMFLIAVPFIIHFFLVIFAQNVTYIYVARFLCGVSGGGIFIIVPVFISEIANERVRGTLGATFVFSANVGVLLGNAIGGYCSYDILPLVIFSTASLFIVLITFFHESPIILLKQNRIAETEKSICFYNNLDAIHHYDILQDELKKLKSIIGNDDIKSDSTSLKWSDFMRIEARRAFAIGLLVVALNQFCGIFAMLSYAVKIFEASGSSLSPVISTIIVASIQVVGSYMPTIFADRIGRKLLMLVSCIGTALGMLIMGAYLSLKLFEFDVADLNWVPIASFSMAVFFANGGMMSLPFLLISETMPDKLKDIGTLVCMSTLVVFCFIVLKCLPFMILALGMHVCLFVFAGVCSIGALILAAILPETNGKTSTEIQKILQKRKY